MRSACAHPFTKGNPLSRRVSSERELSFENYQKWPERLRSSILNAKPSNFIPPSLPPMSRHYFIFDESLEQVKRNGGEEVVDVGWPIFPRLVLQNIEELRGMLLGHVIFEDILTCGPYSHPVRCMRPVKHPRTYYHPLARSRHNFFRGRSSDI